MADRYFVMGQVFIANGTTTVDKLGRFTTDQTITCAGAGNFTIFMTQGMAGTVTSGTAAITGSVVTLAAGLNTLTAGGNGTCTLDVTIGSAANWNHVNSWSAASGGTAGASVPTSSDNAYFDANSFTAGSQTVTVDAAANCLGMDWTDATNTPALHQAATPFKFYSNVTFITAMTFTNTGANYLLGGGAGAKLFTSNDLTIPSYRFGVEAGTLTLQDDLVAGELYLQGGIFDSNGKTVTCSRFSNFGGASTITLGASTVNVTGSTGLVLTGLGTLNVGTSTIKLTGTAVFTGAGLTYNNVELNGTAHTISGNNTFNTLTLQVDTTQTITFTDGTTQTAATLVLTGSAAKIKTLTGTGAAGWKIVKTGSSYVDCDYMAITYSYAAPADTFYAGSHSTNSGGNSGWLWTPYANRARRGGGSWFLLRR